jgi:hypothetical protein
MQKVLKPGLLLLTLMAFLFSMSGCAEQHYYHRNHHHTRHYYERRHMPPPPGVDIDIHN